MVPPERAVWIPAHTPHKVGSPSGAKFRTLYVADLPHLGLFGDIPAVVSVSPLLRELIVEAVAIGAGETPDHDEYAGQITALILTQLRSAHKLTSALPWPSSKSLTALCENLYADPSDSRSLEEFAKSAAMSGRTLSRRFEKEVGMTLGAWRRKLRLFNAIDRLTDGVSVTDVALDLGYSTPSAFIHMFRLEVGMSPTELLRAKGTHSPKAKDR